MENSFPLLRLSPAVLTEVLKSMETLDQICLSFVSKRTKALVVSLNLQTTMLELMVSNTFRLHMYVGRCDLTFVLCPAVDETPAPLIIGDSVRVVVREEDEEDEEDYDSDDEEEDDYHRRTTYQWRKEAYDVRNWIDHLMTVTHQTQIIQINFSGTAEMFSFNSINDAIVGLHIHKIDAFKCSAANEQAVLEAFPIRNVSINGIPRANPEQIQKILMQNYDSIEMLTNTLKLNELQSMNSRVIHIISVRNHILNLLNPFLKLWRNGTCPNLELLQFDSACEDFNLDMSVVLKGIKHTIVDNQTRRTFKWLLGSRTVQLSGGFDFKAIDKRKATIFIENPRCVCFCVWPN